MHEFVCHPYFNQMELWTLDPNLHLSSYNTLFCLIACLFASFICFICLFSLVWHLFLACLYHASPSMCFFACLLAYFFCLCMYTLGARERPPRRKQKRQECKQEDASPQRAMISRLGGLETLERSFLSLSLSLFSRACIRVPLHVPLPFTFPALCLGRIPKVWLIFPVPCWAIPLEC